MNDFINFLAIIGGLAMGALLIWLIILVVQEIHCHFHGDTEKAEADFRSEMRWRTGCILDELRILPKIYEHYTEMLGKQMSHIEKQIAELKDEGICKQNQNKE